MGRIMKQYNIVIIGGGPAGLSAAVSAKKSGCSDLLILERENKLGGILNQCIHNGFGLHTFKEELTGPEYAQRYTDQIIENQIPYKLNTMVLDISPNKVITYVNSKEGVVQVKAEAIILAMGCRERPRGALTIPGTRPAGIYTAGTAQKLVNIYGYMPGRKVVILGSGDIGLIMARRMTLEGAEVKLVAEIMPYSAGLKRNIVQCLDDYNIPLQLSHTVVDIKGKERVESVTVAEVDDELQPIPGTEVEYECDTLLLSVGLIPENELSTAAGVALGRTNGPIVRDNLETSVPGIFACGNVLHVHDLVDYVSEEAAHAGEAATEYVKNGEKKENKKIKVIAGDGVSYTVPTTIDADSNEENIIIRFRVKRIYQNSQIGAYLNDKEIKHQKKRIFAPGEMQQVVINKEIFDDCQNGSSFTVQIEEAQ